MKLMAIVIIALLTACSGGSDKNNDRRPAPEIIEDCVPEVVYIDRNVTEIVYIDRNVTVIEECIPEIIETVKDCIPKIVYVDRNKTVIEYVDRNKTVIEYVDRNKTVIKYVDRNITEIVYVDKNVTVPVIEYVDRNITNTVYETIYETVYETVYVYDENETELQLCELVEYDSQFIGRIIYKDKTPYKRGAIKAVGSNWVSQAITDDNGYFKLSVKGDDRFQFSAFSPYGDYIFYHYITPIIVPQYSISEGVQCEYNIDIVTCIQNEVGVPGVDNLRSEN